MNKEKSSGLTNAPETSSLISGEIKKGEELQKTNPIEGTPFIAKWIENVGWFAVCGKYRLTEPMETEEELIKYVNDKPYELIIVLVNIVVMESTKLINEVKQEENGN
jgi:hypothetical protein